MAYGVQLYKTSDPANKVVKSLTSVDVAVCNIYNEEDVLNPVLFIDRGGTVTDMSAINYCYISAFGRYYYCRVVHDKTRIWIHCSVDPLMSLHSSIKALRVRVIRQENEKLSYLQDSQLPIKANKIVEHKFISNALSSVNVNNKQLILAVI